MTALDLRPFLQPGSTAVVGAGKRATSSGGAVPQMLPRASFAEAGDEGCARDAELYGLFAKHGLGVPLFGDVEEMAECAAILSRYPAQKKTAVASPPPSTPPALKGRR